jgi:hypothetical protein
MAANGISPLELVTQQVEQRQFEQESLASELESLPRWRFRRRLETERKLRRRQEQTAVMQDLLQQEGQHS